MYSRRGSNPAAAFLHRLTEKHDVFDAEFLIDAGGYLIALARQELSDHSTIQSGTTSKKWFQTVQCESTAFTRFGGAVRPARNASCDGSDTTTIDTD